jgi:phospholipid/cholesterol/gamma-HCH transport system substrate-binding protein
MSRYFRVGLFLIATLLILAIGIFLIGSKDLRFGAKYIIQTQFDNVSGLQTGADVRVGGIHVGTVSRIVLPNDPRGKVTVVMQMEKSTQHLVNRASVAAINSEGLLGDKYVEVSFGEPGAESIHSGDRIASVPPVDIADLVKQANDVLSTTDQALQNVKSTTSNLDQVTAKINQGQGTVGALINNKDLYQRVDSGVTAFQEDMEALKHNFLVRGFFKSRGYEDAGDLGKYRIDRLPSGQPEARYAFDGSKIFDKPGSAKLRDHKALDEAGKYLETHPYGLAVIVDSEGALGDSDKDRTTSEARAMVVRDYLVQKFKVDDKRIKTLPLGKSEMLGDSARLEVVAYPMGSMVGGAARQKSEK